MGEWSTIWYSAQARAHEPTDGDAIPVRLANATLRMFARPTASAGRIRVRLSNACGGTPLPLTAVRLALRAKGSAINPETLKLLTFDGSDSTRIPAHASIVSDPIDLELGPQDEASVSIHFGQDFPIETIHKYACKTNYIAQGDQTGHQTLEGASEITFSTIFNALEGQLEDSRTLVVIGDSLTDACDMDIDARWSDLLAQRLRASGEYRLAIANAALGGNRLLHDGYGSYGRTFGHSLMARFDRDVLGVAGVAGVIILIGVNDIGLPIVDRVPPFASPQQCISAQELTSGLRQLSLRARAAGLKVFAATLLPFGGSEIDQPDAEATRIATNEWLRGPGARYFEAVFDFDQATCDPDNPSMLRADCDSGDHLHQSAEGSNAMAHAVDLDCLQSLLT